MISIKLNVFFIISKKLKTKKKKNFGPPVNRGLARSGRGLARFGPKKPGFKRAEKSKDLTLKFSRLNGPARGPPALLTALVGGGRKGLDGVSWSLSLSEVAEMRHDPLVGFSWVF